MNDLAVYYVMLLLHALANLRQMQALSAGAHIEGIRIAYITEGLNLKCFPLPAAHIVENLPNYLDMDKVLF